MAVDTSKQRITSKLDYSTDSYSLNVVTTF